MKIAVVCANGKAGILITKEAIERGLDVTAVVRSKMKAQRQRLFKMNCAILQYKPAVFFPFI